MAGLGYFSFPAGLMEGKLVIYVAAWNCNKQTKQLPSPNTAWIIRKHQEGENLL